MNDKLKQFSYHPKMFNLFPWLTRYTSTRQSSRSSSCHISINLGLSIVYPCNDTPSTLLVLPGGLFPLGYSVKNIREFLIMATCPAIFFCIYGKNTHKKKYLNGDLGGDSIRCWSPSDARPILLIYLLSIDELHRGDN